MTKKGALSVQGEFLNFMVTSLSETTAATYKELEIDTNLSAERGMLMEIHSIEVDRLGLENLIEVAAGALEVAGFHLARESKTALLTINDRDAIISDSFEVARSAAIGTDSGPLYIQYERYKAYHFPKPIPYVKPSLFLGVKGSDASAFTGVNIRIGYTLREIDLEDFLSLLVAIQ